VVRRFVRGDDETPPDEGSLREVVAKDLAKRGQSCAEYHSPSADTYLRTTPMSIAAEPRKDGIASRDETAWRASYTGPTDVLVLANGTRLRFRPIRASDSDRIAALFARLGFESRRRRFFTPKHELTPRELRYFTDIDHVGHEAIAAVDLRDDSIVGVARYVRVGDPAGVAEVAAEVADGLQKMGVGSALAERLIERARASGVRLLIATSLWENGPALALLRSFGFRTRASDGCEVELQLELKSAGACSRKRPHPCRLCTRAVSAIA
jgi:GNAT superfamily N-acetyltransferase